MERENNSKSDSLNIKDNDNEIIKDNVTKSSSSSFKSSKKSKSKKVDLESEDISLSQLELMANKKKIAKPADQISIVSKKISSLEEKKEDTRKYSTKSSMSSTSSSSDDTKVRRKKEKLVYKENQNDAIRKEKNEYLSKFNKLNIKGKWSSLHLDMNCTLDEIRNEYERVRNEISNERSVAFFKRMLLLGVQGIEMLNTRFDPMGVDLDGWSEAMGYSMENEEYDEVMAELCEKYKGRGQMSPELRLVFMIVSSATMFTISKKISKLDSNNALTSLLGGLMNKMPSTQQATQQTKQQQLYQNQQQNNQQQQFYQQQLYNQQLYNQQMQQQQQQPNFYRGASIPNANQLRRQTSETSEDELPSKINNPNNNYLSGEKVDIDHILKTMKERKEEKEKKEKEISETSDDILKSIQISSQKKRGRPKKGNATLRL